MLRVDDDRLDRLGKTFEHFGFGDKFGITFERFVYLVVNGLWNTYVNHAS